jgi:hypothetical protein
MKWIPLVLFFSSLFGEIIETVCFKDVALHLEEGTLLIFDIDNTLMEPAQQLGTDQWFYHRVDEYEKKGCCLKDAIDFALPEWMAVQSVTKVLPVEESIPFFINELQEKGVCCIGLTTRGLGLSDRTIHQLSSIQIDLNKTSPSKKELFFFNKRGVLYREGILFTAGTHKGEDLFMLLDFLDLKPKKIVFINDKRSHIMEVEESVVKRQIPFVGLRYGFTDKKVASLDKEIVDIQWAHFGKILSDEEASTLNQKF